MRTALAMLLFLSGSLLAQPPRAYFPWWEGPLTRSLNLTDAQREQIRDILREHRDEMIDRRAAMEKAEAEVEDLFNEEAPEGAKAKAAIDQLVAARGAMTRTFTEMSLKLRRVLTTEQWNDLQQRRSEWRSRVMRDRASPGRRPPGPRGPRPGEGAPEPPSPPPDE